MKSMNPNKVAFIEALNYDFSKQPIDRVVGGPKVRFASTITVNHTLPDIIHRVL
jgi:hypothetical protein